MPPTNSIRTHKGGDGAYIHIGDLIEWLPTFDALARDVAAKEGRDHLPVTAISAILARQAGMLAEFRGLVEGGETRELIVTDLLDLKRELGDGADDG